MNIVILSGISIVLTISTWIYLLIQYTESEKRKVREIFKSIKKSLSVNIYSACMVLILIVLSVVLESLYKSNILTWNIKLIVLAGLMFPAAYIDYKEHIIPNLIIIVGIIIRMVIWLVEFFTNTSRFWIILKGDIIACVIVIAFFLICSFIVKNGIGMGDIKLMGLMALYQGMTGIMSSLFFSMLIAFIIAIVLLIVHRKTRKDTIPFAPSVLLGTICAIAMTGL